MFRKIKAWIRRKQTEIKAVTTNKHGEFYLDKVIGGLLLAGLYALFNNTVLAGLTDKIQSMVRGTARSERIEELQIVPDQLFFRVQQILEERTCKEEHKRTVCRSNKSQSLLGGNLFCGHCGCCLVASRRTEKTVHKDGSVKERNYGIYVCYHRSRGLNDCDGATTYIADRVDKFGTDLKNTTKTMADSSSAFLGKLFGMKSPKYGQSAIESSRRSSLPTLRSASDISENGLKDESTLLKKATNEGNKALIESLSQSIADETEYTKKREEIEKSYSDKQIGVVGKALGDIAYGAGYALPGIATNLVIPYASVALMGTANFSSAYAQAKSRNYNDEQALRYAALASIPKMGGEVLFNQLTASVTNKPIAKAVSKIANPYARAAADVGINVAGEGVEGMLESLYDTAVRNALGDKDAKVNPSEIAYQGLLSAGGSLLFGAASYPGKVKAYKVDVDLVNAYSKAAAKVDSNEKADILSQVGDMLSEKASKIINDPSSSREDIIRANFCKQGIDEVNSILKGYKDRIIIDNQEMDAAVNSVIFSSADDMYNSSLDLALVVAKNLEPDENPVNATVDTIRDKIQDKKEEIRKTTDPEEKKSLENQVEQLKKADETVRANRDEIENAVEEQRKAEANEAKADKPAESAVKTADTELTADNDNAIIEKDLTQVSKDKGEKLEDSNVKLSKDFEDYSINQQDVIEGYEESVDTSFREFIEREMRGELKQNDSYSLKNVSDKAAADIKKAVGVDTTGFKTAIEARMITHILQSHGENGTTDHSMANIDDIARMQFVIDNYDNIEDGGKCKSYFESYVSRSGDVRQHTARTVVYSKKVNGVYYVVEAVPDTKKRTAYIVSAYMAKKERNELSNENNNEDVAITRSETSDTAEKSRAFESAPDAHSFDKIISNNSDAVNSESEKSSKDFSLTHKKYKHTQTGETLELYTIDGYISKDKYSELKDKMKSVGGYYSKFAGGFIVKSDGGTTDNAIEAVKKFANVNDTRVTSNKPDANAPDSTEVQEVEEAEASDVTTETDTADSRASDTEATVSETKPDKTDKETKEVTKQNTEKDISGGGIVTSKTETSDAETAQVKEKHRAMENGVLPDVKPDVVTVVPEAGEAVAPETVAADSIVNTYYSAIADRIVADYLETGKTLDSKSLFEIANSIYGGTLSEGVFDVKDATDALELAVNRYLLKHMQERAAEFNGSTARSAENGIVWMEELLARVPTQTKRTDEQVRLQQFSTPPNIAYLANWLANISDKDFMLEPSAGIGGLATFAKAFGAVTCVNEISQRRLGALRSLGFDHVTSEDGAQLDNILPDFVKPTVVVMNPPFSSTGGRTKNNTANAKPHVEQALHRLEEGGRLVAILGQGMSNDAPAFAKWWDSLRQQGYNIRANIGIDGSNYRKYGTTFNIRLVVIDKDGTSDGASRSTLTGDFTKLYEIPKVLEEIRNDRRKIVNRTEPNEALTSSEKTSKSGVSRRTQSDIDSGNDGVSDRNNMRPDGIEVQQVRSGESERNLRENGVESERQPENIRNSDDILSGSGRGNGGGRTVDGREQSGNSGIVGESDTSGTGRMGTRERGRADARSDGDMVRSGTGVSGASVNSAAPKKANIKKAVTNDDGVYAQYVPSTLTVKNAQPHAANIVESSAMAAVAAPVLTYVPHLDQSIIDNGALSGLQLENITYAGQAHLDTLPDGSRKGYFIGDGTGVGKGRQAAGIILDNFNQRRKKALWVSVNGDLMADAQRDWKDIGGDLNVFFNKDMLQKAIDKKAKGNGDLPREGILFTTYNTIGYKPRENAKNKTPNSEIIVNWLGKDFDGVIIFDEAHKMNNLIPGKGKRGADKAAVSAIEADKIQKSLPNARVVYMSATGASDVKDLCFASRLGIWGSGTPFSSAEDFVDKIGAAGISAMEMVASSLKAMGVYQARSISYDGVKYSSIKHPLTSNQQEMYDTFCEAWQVIYQNMERALSATMAKDNARSQFYSMQQNFFNQVLTSMQMPTVIDDMKNKLAKGESCVLQLTNTNEAQTSKEIEKSKAEGKDLDELDITPRGALLGFLENSFPVEQYEEYLDEHGNKGTRRVVDSNGNPVLNKQAVKMREELIARVNEMSIPQGPLDMVIEVFGADKVAEITGRGKRVVTKMDENGNSRKVVEPLSQPSFRMAEAKAFQNDEKQILIFSGAGSTGVSFHADKRAKNQRKRNHYIIQTGFNAKVVVQSFGRTLRTNMASLPEYILCSTNVAGQARFVSTIARRLDQLGALTKGQRQTGSGVFGEKDNLESPLSVTAMHEFMKRLGNNSIKGVDGKSVFEKLGFAKNLYDKNGSFKAASVNNIEMSQFLNRLLALKVDEQNIVFGEFENIRQQMYDTALENGTLDTGISNVKADKIAINQENVIYTDPKTGAEAKYVQATAYRKPVVIETVEDAQVYRNAFVKIVRLDNGSVRAVYRISDETDAFGNVSKRYLLQSPNVSVQNRFNEKTLKQRTTDIPKEQWEAEWNKELENVPEYNESNLHIITGTLLPVWNKLPQDGNVKAMKIVTDSGEQILGRIIPENSIDAVLRQLDVKKRTVKLSGTQIYDSVMKNDKKYEFSQSYVGKNTIQRKRVANENRIEITGTNMWQLQKDYPAIFTETIQGARRYFIPTGKKGIDIIEAINKQYPMKAIGKTDDVKSLLFSTLKGRWGKGDKDGVKLKSLNDLKEEATKLFGVEINTGKIGARGAAGIYNTHAGTIRTRVHGDLPTIAHEIGHHFDKLYNLSELPEIDTLIEHYRQELEDAGYNESLYPKEAVACYFADLMRDAEKTREEFPEFTDALEERAGKIFDSEKNNNPNNRTLAANLYRFMKDANEYHAADRIRRREAQVHYRHKDNSFLGKAQFQVDTFIKNPAAYTGRLGRRFIADWIDDVYDLKKFGRAHDSAFRERAGNSIASGRLTIAFTDLNNNIIGKSLAAVLDEGGINDLNNNAWTPTFPKIEYEANSKVTDKLRDKYYELYGKFGHEKISALYPYGNYFEEQLNTDGGVDGIISKQSNNPQMMQVYLADTQGKTVDSVVKETKTTLPSEQVEQSEFIIDKLGADTVNEMRPQANESPISARKRWMSEHGDAFKAAYTDYLMQSGLTSEEAQNAIDNMTKAQLLSQMVKTRNYLANGAETVKSEVDTEATNNAIKEAVNQEDYLKWLHSLFDGGEKKSGVSNGKEPYTRNGNRRPFSATHYPVTLDNIVLSMKSQGDGNAKNATSIFVGSKTIRAESAAEYSSLDEIRADKGRLAHRTPEEAKAAWDEFDNRLSAIINRIMDAESGIDNRFIEQDRIGSVLAEASRNNTETNIKKVLTQYKLTPAVAADFKALVDDIKSAPVDIFEAKPERVVGLDEVKYAIVPSDVNSDVTTALNNAGIETKTYENGNEADRLKVLNTLSDVRFSKQLDTDTSSEITQADVEQLRSIGRKSIFEFTSEDIQKSEKWAKKFYSELGTKSPFFRAWFGDWRENDTGKTNVVTVPTIDIRDAVLEYGDYHIKDTDWDVYAGRTLKDDTTHHSGGERINVKSLNSINAILENAVLLDTVVSENNTNKKAKYTAFLHKLYTPIIYNSKEYLAVTTVEEYYDESKNGVSRRAYNLKNIKIESADGRLEKISTSPMSDTDSTVSISDLYALVKRYDKDFKSQPSSKVVNADGSPKVVYHGTSNGGFNSFNTYGSNFGLFGIGSYFTDDSSVAEGYTRKGKGTNPQVYSVYLDIKNPIDMDAVANADAWKNAAQEVFDEGYFENSKTNEDYFNALKEYCADEEMYRADAYEFIENAIEEMGYDGITHIGGGRFNKDSENRHRVYIAFDPTQIKSVDNLGTFDKSKGDIRYSKQLDANGKEFVRVDDTTIDEKNPKDIVKALKQIAESKGFYNMEINGQSIGLSNERGIQEWVYSKDAKSLYRNNKTAFNDKIQSFQNADELIEAAKSFINEEAVHKKKFDNFARGEIRFKVGDNGYLADILVGIRRNQSAELYDIVNITPIKITENSGRYVTDNTVQTGQEFSVDSSVPQTNSNVNTNAENSPVNSSTETDIRYSRELLTPEQKKIRRLEERNDFLERQLVQTNPLGGKARAVSPTTKAKIAKQLATGMPGVRTSEVNEKLTEVFNAIEHSGAGTREEYRDAVTKAAEKAATELYNDFKVDNVNPLYEEFTDLYKHIRGMKFKITDTVKNDMNDFAEFKKSVRGVLRFDNENGLPVDTAYMELYDMQPSLFADNTGEPIGNQGDQLIRIAEVQEKISKEAGHPYQDASQEDDAYIIRTIRDAILSSYVENSKETLASQNKTLRRENEKLSEKAAMTDTYAKELRDVRTMYDNQTKEELARIYREFVSQVKDQQKQLEKNSEKIERLNDRISRNNVNAAQKTALREIGRLHDMLTNPTKQKHIPQELRIAVGRYLNTLNGTKLLNGKTVNFEAIKSELSDDYSRILSQIGDVTSKLTRSSLDGKPTDYISASKEQINMLERKVKYISELAHGETVDMSDNIDFIRNITDITRIVNHLVKDSNDLFTGARTEEAVDFANEWKSELSGHKSKVGEIGSERSGLKKWFDGVGYSLMSADLFFGTMGESGEKISGWYRNAQTRQVKMKREYAEYMKKLLGDNYSTIAGSVKARNNLIDVEIAGEKIKVSKNQLMSLYLLWNRPAGRRHMKQAAFLSSTKTAKRVKPTISIRAHLILS